MIGNKARFGLIQASLIGAAAVVGTLLAVHDGRGLDAQEPAQASVGRELLVVGEQAPVAVSGQGFQDCAGQVVEMGWIFRVAVPGGPAEERRFGATSVAIDDSGAFDATLPPLKDFPGAWDGAVGYWGDCVEFGSSRWLAVARVGVPLGSSVAESLGLTLPAGIMDQNPAVLVYPREWLGPGFVLPDEDYTSPQEKLLRIVGVQVGGRDCFASTALAHVTTNGSVLFPLGVTMQPADCGVEGATARFTIGQGETRVESLSDAKVRRGIIQPLVLVPPPPASGRGPGDGSTSETPAVPALGSAGSDPETLTPVAHQDRRTGEKNPGLQLFGLVVLGATVAAALLIRRFGVRGRH